MTQYALRRIVLIVPTLIGITIVVFMAVRFLPGDVVDQIAGEFGAADPEMRAQIMELYSLDESMPQQYLIWMGDLVRGDLGVSIISGRPVGDEVLRRFPASAQLGVMAIGFAMLVGIPVGMLAAIRQDTFGDYFARSASIILLSVPNFWLGVLAITYGFIWFGWTPPLRVEVFWEDPIGSIRALWLPAIILSSFTMAVVMRLGRSTLLEVFRQDYVRTARAKGVSEPNLLWRHAARNAMIPVVTMIGLQIPNLVGGTVIIENIFSIPGVGRYLFTSIQLRDYPVVQAVVLFSAVLTVVTNVVVDLSYSLIDPRIRYNAR